MTTVERITEAIRRLPPPVQQEVLDFAEFLMEKGTADDEQSLQKGIEQIVSDSQAFAFLADDDDLYTRDDLKVRFK